MEIFFSIVSILSLIFCILVIVDMTLFSHKIRIITTGMTGKEIQVSTGLKLKILKIEPGNVYYARINSHLNFFRYRLVFYNGKLISKQKD